VFAKMIKLTTSINLKLPAMRKSISIFLFLNFYLIAYNQVIRGTIMDQMTREKIYFAYVYINGTFVGTTSDKNGNFELDISKYYSMPLTISAIGYYSVILTVKSTDKPILIYLKPKVYELNEVVINAKTNDKERKENLRLFRNEFIGTTWNARNCEITNETDIKFVNDKDTLKAFSSKPIHIDNKALGYKVTYFLDEFEFTKRSQHLFFTGNIIFNEDLTTGEEQKKTFEKRRKNAYFGSIMHFFRALWGNKLDSTGFIVKNSASIILNYNNIVVQVDSLTKFLKYPENLDICFNTALSISNVIFLDEEVFFDENGYFDPSGISWSGVMAKQRIADWLPYEYSPKK